jgi:hypothetical protein
MIVSLNPQLQQGRLAGQCSHWQMRLELWSFFEGTAVTLSFGHTAVLHLGCVQLL